MTVGAVGGIEGAEVHLGDGVEHRPDEVVLGNPLA
jgi:hypothetical protein